MIRSVDNVRAADGLEPRPRVVVVGVGHGGIEATKALRRARLDVLVVDRNNYHAFQPLYYQVATAGLAPNDITQPARHIFRRQGNSDFRLGEVVGADLEARTLKVEPGPPVGYDYLILAAGAVTAYFGVEGAEAHSFGLKSVPDALALRGHVLRQFEAANRNPALVEDGVLTFVVVGGGPTGVEMAGALMELIRHVLTKDFPGLDVGRARVVLVERDGALLASYKPALQAYTRRSLEKRGVEVMLDTVVARVTPEAVHLKGGDPIATRTVVWGAGIKAHPLAEALGVAQTSGGRVAVGETLQLPGHPRVFVVGDMAGATDPTGALYPQVAQVAIQQGQHAARTIERLERGLEPEPFAYRDLGQMATIGRNAAVLQLPSGFTLKGFLAWLGWALLHVVALVGFRNQLSVFFNWLYSYVTYERGPRLILTSDEEVPDAHLVASAADPGPA